MVQVSKYRLDKDIEREMFRQFWVSISQLRSGEEVAAFFTDLLSDTEELMLAKRFTIALLLLRGKKPIDITKTLHVSFSTIASVASWVKNAKPQTQKVLKRLIEDDNWQVLLDRIEAALDKLPPMVGTDWHRVGQEKWERVKQRAKRSVLR